MKFFIATLCCLVAAASAYPVAWWGGHWAGHGAPLGPDGRVVDTPEVAHAKAAHFAAKAAATHGAWNGWNGWNDWNNGWAGWNKGWAGYNGHWAGHGAAPLGPDGRVVDTPEVAHAKAAHFAAKAAASHGAYAPGYAAYYPHW